MKRGTCCTITARSCRVSPAVPLLVLAQAAAAEDAGDVLGRRAVEMQVRLARRQCASCQAGTDYVA